MRALAQRITHLNTEIAHHDRAMTALLSTGRAPARSASPASATSPPRHSCWPGPITVAAATKQRSLDSPEPHPSRRRPDKPRTVTASIVEATGE